MQFGAFVNMMQAIAGYTFSVLAGILAIAMFVAMFFPTARTECFIMFVLCALLSVLFAWMGGV